MPEIGSAAIEGRVAKVLNKREVVVNRGSAHGVERGMQFGIIEESEQFIDPETNEPLGAITRTKIRVRVSDVQPRFSIARTYETYQVNEPQSYVTLGLRMITKVKTISAHRDDFSDTSYERTESYVNVGDKVVQIVDN